MSQHPFRSGPIEDPDLDDFDDDDFSFLDEDEDTALQVRPVEPQDIEPPWMRPLCELAALIIASDPRIPAGAACDLILAAPSDDEEHSGLDIHFRRFEEPAHRNLWPSLNAADARLQRLVLALSPDLFGGRETLQKLPPKGGFEFAQVNQEHLSAHERLRRAEELGDMLVQAGKNADQIAALIAAPAVESPE